MAEKPETLFTQKVLRRLRTEFPQSWFTKNQAGSIIGIPDIIGCVKGKLVAWELKVGRNKPTRIQAYVLMQIQNAGGHSEVVTPENFEFELKRLSRSVNESIY